MCSVLLCCERSRSGAASGGKGKKRIVHVPFITYIPRVESENHHICFHTFCIFLSLNSMRCESLVCEERCRYIIHISSECSSVFVRVCRMLVIRIRVCSVSLTLDVLSVNVVCVCRVCILCVSLCVLCMHPRGCCEYSHLVQCGVCVSPHHD